MVRNIVIFGPQGSGKGTQAEMLSEKLHSVYISTGNIFRQNIERKTNIGKEVLRYTTSGQLVPDTITNKVILERLSAKDVKERGFILDGYPRNHNQMEALDSAVGVTDVLVIHISDREAVFRIGKRRSCVCGKTYHLVFNHPKAENVCDACGRKLFVRNDDMPEAIKKRLEIYHRETEPLVEHYQRRGIVKEINGEQIIAKVHQDVVKALGIKV